jgi:hypothetical protein
LAPFEAPIAIYSLRDFLIGRKLSPTVVQAIEALLSPDLKKPQLEAIAKIYNTTYSAVQHIQQRVNQICELGFDLHQIPGRPRGITVGIEAVSYSLSINRATLSYCIIALYICN